MNSTEPAFAEQLSEDSTRAMRQSALAREIIACLRVNLLRQTLTTKDALQFEAMLDAWSERLEP